MPDSPTNLFPHEDEEDIYLRLLDDLANPPGGGGPTKVLNAREGSGVHMLLRPLVIEHQRFTSFAQFIIELGFLRYTQGDWLDAKAAEYGAFRQEAVQATVDVTFVGEVGTLIPLGTTVSTEATDEFDAVAFVTQVAATIPIEGFVVIGAIAQEPSSLGNVGAGDITLLESTIFGVEQVYNEVPAIGGEDVEDDESLRLSALTRAQSLPMAGNKATYRILATDDIEVYTVQVEDFWEDQNGIDGNGTARLIIGGDDTPWVSPEAVERLQDLLDPTIKNLVHFENEVWTGGTLSATDPIEGQASRRLNASTSGTASMNIDKPFQLGAWDDMVNDEIRVSVRRTTASNTINTVVVQFYAPGGAAVAKAEATVSAATFNAIPNVTAEGLMKIVLGSFTVTNGTGTFSWNNIGGVRITLNASGSGPAEVHFDGLRIRRGRGMFDEGEVPVGIQLTVRSARSQIVDVAANIATAPGTIITDVEGAIDSAISEYFKNLTPGETVRIAEIANVIHDTDGVVDYDSITLNTVAANLTLTADQRPILGVTTYSAM